MYLLFCPVIACFEYSHYGYVEKEEYSWVDINWPIMVGINNEVVGHGAVSWYDDVLQTEQPTNTKTYTG